MKTIQFGTSGHRGIIGQSFTNDHLKAIARALANYFKLEKISKPIILIGYDTRTGNSPSLEKNSYTHTLVHELLNCKIMVDFCDNYTPTPVISWAVNTHTYNLGIILTASHNPPNYNGIKINDESGAPAPVELTDWIQNEANKLLETIDTDERITFIKPHVTTVNYIPEFIDHLTHLLKQNFKLPFPDFSNEFVIDPKCGSSIEIWRAITSASIGEIHWFNDNVSPDFNFKIPNPTSNESISELSEICKRKNCIAFSNDPDADRHTIIDEKGYFISPEKITAIITNYCFEENITVDSIATTLANSALIKKICNEYNITCHETNIGFKFFTPFLKSAQNQNKLAIGVESSGGFSISLHTFDKCGFLPILLLLGIMKKRNKTLHFLSSNIDQLFSKLTFIEDTVNFPPQTDISLNERLSIKKHTLDRLFDEPIISINYNDGLKITFQNDDWVLCRPSGTEPLIRIYAESTSADESKAYIKTLKGYLEDHE